MGTGHSEDLNSKSMGCKICALNPSFKAPYLIPHGVGEGKGEAGEYRCRQVFRILLICFGEYYK